MNVIHGYEHWTVIYDTLDKLSDTYNVNQLLFTSEIFVRASSLQIILTINQSSIVSGIIIFQIIYILIEKISPHKPVYLQ